jgi:hypothetical protein
MPTTRLTPQRQRWEYHLVSFRVAGFFGVDVNLDTMGQRLDELGSEGWELINTVSVSGASGAAQEVVLLFKRPRIEV